MSIISMVKMRQLFMFNQTTMICGQYVQKYPCNRYFSIYHSQEENGKRSGEGRQALRRKIHEKNVLVLPTSQNGKTCQ